MNGTWWCKPIILVRRKWRQEDQKFDQCQVGIGAPLAKTKTKAGRCSVTPALRVLRQEDEKFEANMSYVVRK